MQADRFRFIEGMRGLAALYVVLSHFCTMSDPRAFLGQRSLAEPWVQQLMSPFWSGHLAVAIFIVISGFCLQVSLFQSRDGKMHDIPRFYRRRARRILPPYYASLALSLVVALTITQANAGNMPFAQYLPVTVENTLAHLLLVHNWRPDWMYKINGVMWSIAVEVQLYIIFPLLVGLFFKIGRWTTLLLSAVLVAVVLQAIPGSVKLVPWYLALFVMGMAFAHAVYRPVSWFTPNAWVYGSLAVVGWILVGMSLSQGWAIPIRDACGGLAAAGMMAAGSLAPWSPWAQILAMKPLVGLGAYSYSLYLIHHPVQQIVFHNRPAWVESESQRLTYLLTTGLPIILLASWIFGLAFERPFMGRRDTAADEEPAWIPLTLPLQTAMGEPRPRSKRGGKSSRSRGAGYGPEQNSANPS